MPVSSVAWVAASTVRTSCLCRARGRTPLDWGRGLEYRVNRLHPLGIRMQFSLFGARPLFDPQTLGRRTREWRDDPIPSLQEKARSIVEFSKEVQRITGNSRSRARVKETELEQGFNRAFFVELLGYKIFPGQDESWTAWPKPKSADTGLSGEPDLLLGQRGRDAFETAAVVELQRPGTPLDGPQPSYHGRSPVEQAFDYASSLPACLPVGYRHGYAYRSNLQHCLA